MFKDKGYFIFARTQVRIMTANIPTPPLPEENYKDD